MDYETYNSPDGELNHVHVEIPYDHLDGDYGHMTRIAEHGVAVIVRDGGWYIHGRGKQTTARFIYNWGSGPVVELVNGRVVRDDHEYFTLPKDER